MVQRAAQSARRRAWRRARRRVWRRVWRRAWWRAWRRMWRRARQSDSDSALRSAQQAARHPLPKWTHLRSVPTGATSASVSAVPSVVPARRSAHERGAARRRRSAAYRCCCGPRSHGPAAAWSRRAHCLGARMPRRCQPRLQHTAAHLLPRSSPPHHAPAWAVECWEVARSSARPQRSLACQRGRVARGSILHANAKGQTWRAVPSHHARTRARRRSRQRSRRRGCGMLHTALELVAA